MPVLIFPKEQHVQLYFPAVLHACITLKCYKNRFLFKNWEQVNWNHIRSLFMAFALAPMP